MNVFGLTGGIASGKSAVSALFRREGVPVVDADEVAREVVAAGSPGLAAIVEAFGPGVLAEDGTLDRKKLGAMIFEDESQRARLNAILHPAIGSASAAHFQRLTAAGHPLACYDAALIVERGIADMFRPLVVVAAPREMQKQRLMARDGLSAADADARLDAQMPVETKVGVADIVIWNDADLATLESRTVDALGRVRGRVRAT